MKGHDAVFFIKPNVILHMFHTFLYQSFHSALWLRCIIQRNIAGALDVKSLRITQKRIFFAQNGFLTCLLVVFCEVTIKMTIRWIRSNSLVMKEKRLSCPVLTRAWGLPRRGCCMSFIPSACRNGRHSGLDFPVTGELYADFGVKEDIDALAGELPARIDAIFLCHGIAMKADGSNALEVQKVNFLGHKYLLEKVLPKIVDNGSVNIIASAGGFGWQGTFDDCAAVVMRRVMERHWIGMRRIQMSSATAMCFRSSACAPMSS